ncbi:MAG TPA: hypothetical protein VJA65_02590 [bacterium]|nr:hypothetical protein [bacterium]
MRMWIAVAVAVGLIIVATAAFATVKDGMAFTQVYSPKSGTPVASAGCALCHTKGIAPTKTALNPYGADLAKQKTRDAAGFKAVEKLDSDKDGFSNLAEIQAGTLPGDPTSKPAK